MLVVYKKHHGGVEIDDRIFNIKVVQWILSYVDDNTILQAFSHDASITSILKEMRKCILTWNKLLQLTGGDLSLGKCKVSVLKWKQNYWGILYPEPIKHQNETITISDKSDYNTEILERLEPDNAERMLGLRLPMTGAMTKEYQYRKNQMETLGQRLYSAPFTPDDAYTVYQSRYKPMIRYALPITIFTEEELNEIQKQFKYLLLPKMGIN